MGSQLQEVDLKELEVRQTFVAGCFKDVEDQCGEVLGALSSAINSLGDPGILHDSQVVRFFALLDVIRKAVKQIDDTIGLQIDGETKGRPAGRLQEKVEEYFTKIGERKAYAAGRCVSMSHVIRASATDIELLKQTTVTAALVKETINSTTLTTWVNELDKDTEGLPILPDTVKAGIKITERFPIKTTKAG